eukprot:scaffold156269_cov28-Tisochrysis_lutea.AAC.3
MVGSPRIKRNERPSFAFSTEEEAVSCAVNLRGSHLERPAPWRSLEQRGAQLAERRRSMRREPK